MIHAIPEHMRRHRRFYGACAAFLLLAAGYAGWLLLTRNFHEVVAGELYRSAQLRPEDIETRARRYGLRSIINLRGANPGAPWYDAEIAQSARLGLVHIDIALSSRKMLSHAESLRLIEAMRQAPKPLLIHCEGGADRTGLAAALYLAAIKKQGEFAAELQMSLIYGHFPLWFLRPFAMDRSFDVMEPDFGYPRS